jgi:hypothetical protein
VPFALYEYDAAFGEFFSETIRRLARSRSPMLSQMHFATLTGTLGSRVRTREGMDVVLEPGETSAEITNDLRAVRDGNFVPLYSELDKASEEMAKGIVGLLVQTMDAVTEGTGNQVDAGGQPFSFEVFYAALEKIDFSVDENDQLVMPSLFVHPNTAAQIEALPPPTPEQEAKMAELLERKREEALARRRRRRLS